MKITLYLVFIYTLSIFATVECKNHKSNAVDEVNDIKDFKKLLRTKNNVLVFFVNAAKKANNALNVFKEAAETVRGQGTMIIIECNGETKKLCKKLKIPTEEAYSLRHYKDGEFHKVYDRKETVTSIVNFMRDPTGDIPWNEDDSLGNDVIHLSNIQSLLKLIKKESLPVLIMFYAPWCGFCKQLKPEYSKAASTLVGKAVLAAIDVNRPENAAVRTAFNITGFPTLHYFKSGEWISTYDGENKHDHIVNFIQDGGKTPPKPKETEWAEEVSDVMHLTDDTFQTVATKENSMLVMFYAPWCGHCKRMKPEYEKAATTMKKEKISGVLAAVDATKQQSLAKKFKVKGYPTIKYFLSGEERWDLPHLRDSDKILSFMKKPEKPVAAANPEPSWEDEPSEVVFLNEENFKTVLKKKRHALVMFYAPWCGHCKATKPEYAKAAEDVRDNLRVLFAAIDCTKHQTICRTFDVNGYPTIKYFHYYNKIIDNYDGGRTKSEFLAYLTKKGAELTTPAPTVKPDDLSDIVGFDGIIRINDANHQEVLKQHKSALVMFYDQGCPSCNESLEKFSKAGQALSPETIILAACECNKNKVITEQYNIKDKPVFKYFKNGRFIGDYKGLLIKTEIESFVHSLVTKDEL